MFDAFLADKDIVETLNAIILDRIYEVLMSSLEDRARRLESLGTTLGRELDEDMRRLKADLNEDMKKLRGDLRASLIRDFEREMASAQDCVQKKDLEGATFHRLLASFTNSTLRELESISG